MLIEMVDNGFYIIMSSVAAGGLEQEWLGKEITREAIEELANLHETCYVCTGGEGGEFETFVINSPLHKKKIEIVNVEKHYSNNSGFLEIKKARLV